MQIAQPNSVWKMVSVVVTTTWNQCHEWARKKRRVIDIETIIETSTWRRAAAADDDDVVKRSSNVAGEWTSTVSSDRQNL